MTETVAAKAPSKPSQHPAALGSEAALVGLLEAMGDGVVFMDEKAIVVRCNKAIVNLVGRPAESIIGRTFLDFVPEPLRDFAHQTVQSLLPGTNVEADWPFISDDGRTLVVRGKVEMLASDGTERYVLLLRDVTAQRAVERRELLFSKVLHAAPVILWTVDKDANFTSIEGRAIEGVGKSATELMGKSCLDEVEGSEGHAAVIRALGGEEVASAMKLGSRMFDAWYLPVKDPFGEPDGMIGLGVDMTRLRSMEGELRNQKSSQELLERVLSSAPFVVASIDPAGTILDASGRGIESLGTTPVEMIGQNTFELFNNPEIAEALTKALGGEETRITTNPAPETFFDTWFMPVRDAESHEVTGVNLLGLDVTERMRAELELRDKLELIERQSATIRALATPIIKVWDELLCLPVIGTVDSARTAEMMDALLQAIVRDQARFAVVDLTGVEVVDTSTADHVIQLFKAANVLGVEGILCGIRPAVAQTVVALGVDLSSVRTMRTLQDALKYCIRTRNAALEKKANGKKRARASSSSSSSNHASKSKA